MAKFINILCDLELQLETVSHALGLIGVDGSKIILVKNMFRVFIITSHLGPAGLQTCSTILHKELVNQPLPFGVFAI